MVPIRLWRRLVVAVTLLAFALRAFHLTAQSLWSDEDITLDRAGQAISEILVRLPVEQAPLYYVAMRAWTLAAGSSDLALRFPSLAFGVLCVPLAACVGAVLAGRRAGLIFALIIAINPFAVYYGQEARMYTLLMLLGLAALACALRAERTGHRRWWMLCGLSAALAAYAHYYGVLVLTVLAGWALLDLARRGRESMIGWLIAFGTAAVAFLPWLPRALGVLGFQGWRASLRLADAPLANLAAWSAGVTSPEGVRLWIVGLYGVLAIGGIIGWLRRGRTLGARRALVAVAAPLAVYAIAILWTVDAAGMADYDPRYFAVALPGFFLAVAAGAGGLPLPARRLAVALLCLAAAVPLLNLYTNPAVQKQDYRAFLRVVEAAAGHEDTVLFLDGPSLGLARRYEVEDSPVKIVDLRSRTDDGRERSEAEITERIAELADEYPHLWLAADGTARGVARGWLDAHAFPVAEHGFQAITLSRYVYPKGGVPPDEGASSQDLNIPEVDPAGGTARPPVGLGVDLPPRVAAGNVLAMVLGWVPQAPITRTYKVSLRLVPPTQRPAVGGLLPRSDLATGLPPCQTLPTGVVAAVDRQPQNGARPSTDWKPGEVVIDRHGLFVPRDTPPGDYGLRIVLYDAATLEPVAAWLDLPITVVPPVAVEPPR